MDARLLTRLTNAGLLAGVGMGVGHLIMPARAGTALLSRLTFVASVAGTGALAAWRERRSLENDAGEEIRSPQPLWLVSGALAALAIAWIAYLLAHW
ncbi:MAG: hypothetical protein JWM95_4148 [Gemmatimonadetes bacterium]|nr:hypothetical protein [Gemmatimonadota bacterium]